MRLMALTVVLTTWVFQSCAAQSVSPEEISFAYATTPVLEKLPDQRQSLAVALQKQQPAYLRGTKEDIQAMAAGAAWRYNLPANFFLNLIRQESSFRSFAVSPAGALGVAQFMPSTADWRGLQDPFEPRTALLEAARYLADLRDEFGNVGLAAAAYNAGSGRLREYLYKRRALPAETRHYVAAVTGTEVDEWVNSGDHEIRLRMGRDNEGVASVQASRRIPRGMPQPHEFAIGRPVPPKILASEREVLARGASAQFIWRGQIPRVRQLRSP
jgi:soluble lytic murein transglycosylase-like protein